MRTVLFCETVFTNMCVNGSEKRHRVREMVFVFGWLMVNRFNLGHGGLLSAAVWEVIIINKLINKL